MLGTWKSKRLTQQSVKSYDATQITFEEIERTALEEDLTDTVRDYVRNHRHNAELIFTLEQQKDHSRT